jgi:hypothetical protein
VGLKYPASLSFALTDKNTNSIIMGRGVKILKKNTVADLASELSMSYEEYVQHLIEKYGPAKYDYFCNTQCKSKNSKISRSSEGLFCHHIAENKEILLSTPEIARAHPFEYQKAHNLVYANYLEHLLLHIKIVEEDIERRGLGLGGVIMISSAINDYYRHRLSSGWRKYATDHIRYRYGDYITIMRYFKNIVDNDAFLSKLLPKPVLAQGWYGKVNRGVHKELYKEYHSGEIIWSNVNVLEYLENLHRK